MSDYKVPLRKLLTDFFPFKNPSEESLIQGVDWVKHVIANTWVDVSNSRIGWGELPDSEEAHKLNEAELQAVKAALLSRFQLALECLEANSERLGKDSDLRMSPEDLQSYTHQGLLEGLNELHHRNFDSAARDVRTLAGCFGKGKRR